MSMTATGFFTQASKYIRSLRVASHESALRCLFGTKVHTGQLVHPYSSDLIEELLLQQKRRRMQLHSQDANVPQMDIIMDAML